MYRFSVEKRDGTLAKFDANKIFFAMRAAFSPLTPDHEIYGVAFKVVDKIVGMNPERIAVEEIQGLVVEVLKESGFEEVAELYAAYRSKREKERNNRCKLLDYKKLVNDYIKVDDWRVKENSTVTYSVGGLILSNSGAITANYWLSEVYDKEVADAHRAADIHIHDLSMLTGYCAGWSLKQLIEEGLGGVEGKITSAPAKHLGTLCNQMVNFLGIMQNEWAGAQAFSSFDTYLAAFVRADNLTYREVKQALESFVFGANTPSRWGCQSPFLNITLDWTVPGDLAPQRAIVGGKEMDFTYGELQFEMDMVNKAFLEIMIEGDAEGRGFQYPIPTYSITKDFDWSESENNKLLFELTAKYGTPYFSNYVNSELDPADIRSMCITADSLVWCKLNGKTHNITIKELYDSDAEEKQISTRYGYRDIKELQRFEYKGDLLKFTTENGKVLTTTIDHEHVIYERPEGKKKGYIKDGRKKIFLYGEEEEGFVIMKERPDSHTTLIKKSAKDLKVGDFISARAVNPGQLRKGKTYEEVYGKEKAKELKELFSEQRKGQVAWNKGIPQTQETKDKISSTLQGHYVSELCRRKSSERWKGKNNPVFNQEYWNKNAKTSAITSAYELVFAEELNSLGLEHIHQYVLDSFVCDFYVPSKNLIIELETTFVGCSYNDNNYNFIVEDSKRRARYNKIRELGYNLLVFNPEEKTDVYRQYINAVEKIINIEVLRGFDGYVYDLEVDCDDVEGDTTMYHTFYANEILTGNCCRLRLDLRELRRKSGGYFGSGESTGSVGVVTINMPKIAYQSADEREFFERLTKLMDISARSLKDKRIFVEKLLEQGLYPYTKRYLGTFNNHFSTIGLVGMNEACLNAKWIGKDLTNNESLLFTEKTLNFMREKLSDYQEQYGDLYNLEATPAESTAFRFAKHDRMKFPDIITANDGGTPYYTNSSHLPVGYTEDVFAALDMQDKLQTLYTSGTVFHTFLGEKLSDWRGTMKFVRTIAENYHLPYYTMSPTYSVCKNHGYIVGEEPICPTCGTETEVYSRITGYYRPIKNWNDGKAQEYKDRQEYKEVKGE